MINFYIGSFNLDKIFNGIETTKNYLQFFIFFKLSQFSW